MLADELGRARRPRLPLRRARRRPHAGASCAGPAALDGSRPTSARRSAPTAGATLVAARPPLVAFNVEVDAPLETAQARSPRSLRERARRPRAGPAAEHGRVQVSTNIEDHTRVTAAEVVAAVRAHAPRHRRRARRARARAPRSPTSRKTCRSAARRRSKIIYPRRPHGPDEAQEADASTAATPPARSRRAAAPAASPPRRSRRRPPARPRATAAMAKPPSWNSAALKALRDGRAAVRAHPVRHPRQRTRRSPRACSSRCSRIVALHAAGLHHGPVRSTTACCKRRRAARSADGRRAG